MTALYLAVILVLAIDQGSKSWARRRRPASVSMVACRRPRWGVVCSSGAPSSGVVVWLLVGLWGAVAIGVWLAAHLDPRFDQLLTQVGLGAAVGGAGGNLLDRVRRGAVVDFIDLRWWPTFNLADVAIISGVSLGLWAWVSG